MSHVLMGNTVRNHKKVTVNYDHQPPPMNEQRLVSNANELLQVKIQIYELKLLRVVRTQAILFLKSMSDPT